MVQFFAEGQLWGMSVALFVSKVGAENIVNSHCHDALTCKIQHDLLESVLVDCFVCMPLSIG